MIKPSLGRREGSLVQRRVGPMCSRIKRVNNVRRGDLTAQLLGRDSGIQSCLQTVQIIHPMVELCNAITLFGVGFCVIPADFM